MASLKKKQLALLDEVKTILYAVQEIGNTIHKVAPDPEDKNALRAIDEKIQKVADACGNISRLLVD